MKTLFTFLFLFIGTLTHGQDLLSSLDSAGNGEKDFVIATLKLHD